MALSHKQREDPLQEAVMGVCRTQYHRHVGKLEYFSLRFGEYLNWKRI